MRQKDIMEAIHERKRYKSAVTTVRKWSWLNYCQISESVCDLSELSKIPSKSESFSTKSSGDIREQLQFPGNVDDGFEVIESANTED